MTETNEQVTVVDNADAGRYELTVDGVLAGFAEYRDEAGTDGPGVRVFPHTVVHSEFEGRGLSKPLIRAALDATRVAGVRARPDCSAVAHFIEKNPDYTDLVA